VRLTRYGFCCDCVVAVGCVEVRSEDVGIVTVEDGLAVVVVNRRGVPRKYFTVDGFGSAQGRRKGSDILGMRFDAIYRCIDLIYNFLRH